MLYSTGHIPDPEAVVQRRKGFHLLKAKRGIGATPLPLKTNNRQWLAKQAGGPGILEQAQTLSCEGHAHASGICLLFAIDQTPIELPDPVGIYKIANMVARIPNADGTLPKLKDEGTEPGLIITGLSEWGAPPASAWRDYPASASTVCDEPTSRDMQFAGEFKLEGAYFMQSTGDAYLQDLMYALAENHPVTGAIAASSGTFQGYSGGVLGELDDGVDHATLWVDYEWDGVNLSSVIVYGVNSWGEQWGEGGLYRANANFLRKYNSASCVLDLSRFGEDS